MTISIGRTTPDVPSGQREPFLNAVDHIETDPLSGVLLKNANNAANESATFLVLGGYSYPIPDLVSRRALGYGDVVAVEVPPQLIAAIRPGLAAGANLSLDTLNSVSTND